MYSVTYVLTIQILIHLVKECKREADREKKDKNRTKRFKRFKSDLIVV